MTERLGSPPHPATAHYGRDLAPAEADIAEQEVGQFAQVPLIAAATQAAVEEAEGPG